MEGKPHRRPPRAKHWANHSLPAQQREKQHHHTRRKASKAPLEISVQNLIKKVMTWIIKPTKCLEEIEDIPHLLLPSISYIYHNRVKLQ
jgi:hypothetical protein